MKSYWELLRDPRWQRKRLEVMQRDNFACLECGDKTTTLNVHHTYYAKGRKPWEYEEASLRTLCEDCHQKTSDKLAEISRLVGSLDAGVADEVLGYVRAQAALNAPGADDQTVFVETVLQVIGACSAIGVVGGPGRKLAVAKAKAAKGKLSLAWLIDASIDIATALREVEVSE